MAIQIIRRAARVETVRHTVNFSYVATPGAGFSFDSTPSGVPLLRGVARQTYRECLDNVKKGTMTGPFFARSVSGYLAPAVGRCYCGCEVELPNPLDNQCDNCGAWFNCCGQQVTDPNSDWGKAMREEDDRNADDDISSSHAQDWGWE